MPDNAELEAQLEEVRTAVLTLAKTHDSHERRLTTLESQLDACHRGMQAAAKGVVEMRERENVVSARLNRIDEALEATRLELGNKATTQSLEALFNLKMDRKAAEALGAELAEMRASIGAHVEGLSAEVANGASQLRGLQHDVVVRRTVMHDVVPAPAGDDEYLSAIGSGAVAARGTSIIRPNCRACGGGGGVPAAGVPPALRPHSAAPRAPVYHTPSSVPEPTSGSNYRMDRFACEGTSVSDFSHGAPGVKSHEAIPKATQIVQPPPAPPAPPPPGANDCMAPSPNSRAGGARRVQRPMSASTHHAQHNGQHRPTSATIPSNAQSARAALGFSTVPMNGRPMTSNRRPPPMGRAPPPASPRWPEETNGGRAGLSIQGANAYGMHAYTYGAGAPPRRAGPGAFEDFLQIGSACQPASQQPSATPRAAAAAAAAAAAGAAAGQEAINNAGIVPRDHAGRALSRPSPAHTPQPPNSPNSRQETPGGVALETQPGQPESDVGLGAGE